MSLHIVLGLADQKPTTEPTVVYAGRSGAAARTAMANSSSARFLIYNNPLGIPKNNPLAAANQAKAAAAAEALAKADRSKK